MIINNIQFNVSLEEIFEELKNQLAINGILYFQRGYRDSGNDIMVQCPYHGNGQERKPSAGIRKSDGQFHCFACNEVHSLPEVISYCFGYNDILGKEGLKWLVKNFATVQVEERKDVCLDFQRVRYTNRYNRLDTDNSVDYVSEKELDDYRYYHEYWGKRGITNNEIIELFDLGYDYNSNCITFPIRDASGRCLFVAKRSVAKKWFNYPRNVVKPLYGLYELEQVKKPWSVITTDGEEHTGYDYPKELFVCESMIDCILLWQAGYYAVALNGTGNNLQFEQLNKLPCRKIILATDNDEAGHEARERIKQFVKYKLFTEIDFPKGVKDIGECTEDELKNIKNWEVF